MIQAEQQRLEAVTGQVAQAEQSLEDAKAAMEKQKKKLEALQKETKTAKTIALTVQDIEAMGKKSSITGNVSLTQDQCETLKRYVVNGIIVNADNKRLKEKLASAEKTASIWKQRYDALNEKYQELKKKAQPYLDALEIDMYPQYWTPSIGGIASAPGERTFSRVKVPKSPGSGKT